MSLVPIENSLTLPDSIDESGLIVGWSLERKHRRQPIGFKFGKAASGDPASAVVNPILMEREGHLMTIAPTGAGKGTGCIVPALLRFDGPVIVIDPKGENALMTVRRRRELGHAVAVIDPMGVTGLATASLNPLDILDPDSPTFVDDAMAMVAALASPDVQTDLSDGGYWRERGGTFVLGVVLHVVSDLPPASRHLQTVRALVNQAVGEIGIYSANAERPASREGLPAQCWRRWRRRATPRPAPSAGCCASAPYRRWAASSRSRRTSSRLSARG